MELTFNELSTTPFSEDKFQASQKLVAFLQTFKASEALGFKRIRTSVSIDQIFLAENFSIIHWLNEDVPHSQKNLACSVFIMPFIRNDEDWNVTAYLQNNFFFEDIQNGIPRQPTTGLGGAHFYNTPAISFSGAPHWEKNLLSIIKVDSDSNAETLETVRNIFSPQCLSQGVIRTFIDSLIPPQLIQSQLQPDEKDIHFRDDHGTDVLMDFAERLVRCPYVNAIVNSIQWNSRATRFIRRIHPNDRIGLIEVVLYWEDEGLGMAIQTTGRNYRETEAIAIYIEEHYI